MMIAAVAKILEDAGIGLFFVYLYVTILKLKRKFLNEEFKVKRKELTVVILVLSLNVFESLSSLSHRLIRYEWGYTLSEEYTWYRQLCVHIFFMFVTYANAMSMLYLFVMIIKKRTLIDISFRQLIVTQR